MITIYQIENTKGRNEQFLPLFLDMKRQNIGKLIDKEYYIVESSLHINPVDRSSQTFSLIQQNINSRGFNYIMYKLY